MILSTKQTGAGGEITAPPAARLNNRLLVSLVMYLAPPYFLYLNWASWNPYDWFADCSPRPEGGAAPFAFLPQ